MNAWKFVFHDAHLSATLLAKWVKQCWLPSPLVGEGLGVGSSYSIHRCTQALDDLIHFLFANANRRRECQCISKRT